MAIKIADEKNKLLYAQPLRVRTIIVGTILAALICIVTPYNNIFLKATPLGGGHFPLAPFFLLIWLSVGVAFVNKFFPSRPFLTGKELLIIWILTVLVSGIAYTGLVRTFFINLTVPHYYATVDNQWTETIHPFLPSSWYPNNKEAIGQLYNGLPGGREMGWIDVLSQIPWNVWYIPLLTWGCFILLSYLVMICLANLLSRQWFHNERMNLPLLQVPQELSAALDKGKLGQFFTNRFVLMGILVPVFLHFINGFHFYFPTVPQIPTLILGGPYFPKYGLFSGFYKLKIFIYPAFIGFAFLTSRQISFSFWFFHLLGCFLFGLLILLGYSIPSSALGVTFGPTLSRPEETQMIGAYGIYFLFILWLGRSDFVKLLKDAFRFRRTTQSRTEWVDPYLSFWGFVAGSFGLVLWSNYFGLPLGMAFLTVGVFFMVMLVASRVICQGGIAYFTLTTAPIDGLITFLGPQMFTRAGILIAAVTQKVLFVDLRESLMPSLLHAGKLTHREKNRKILLTGIVIVLLIGVITSFITMLTLCYKFGIRELQLDWATRTTIAVYENVNTLMASSAQPSKWVITFSIIGALVMLVLVTCYHRFYWWPIHPIGYLTAYSSAMRILWFSFFIGWMCNALCIRYGGLGFFRRFRYFFIGLIIGDFLMGGLWAIVGLFVGESYHVLPI